MQINDTDSLIQGNSAARAERNIPISSQPVSPVAVRHAGHPKGASSLHAKHPSAISRRLKLAGVDWIDSFAVAIKTNDKALLNLWLRLLPYLIVTGGRVRVKRFKGRASKAAMQALEELESR